MIKDSLQLFLSWFDKNGLKGFDPYDLWASPYGLWSKGVFYHNKYVGMVLVAPVVVADMFFPWIRSALVKKKRYATSDAHLIMGLLNLYSIDQNAVLFNKARETGGQLADSSIPGYAGKCYGYPFDWQNNRGLWKKGTPYITVTPYCFEAFLKLFEATGEDQFRLAAKSVADFAYSGLNKTELSADVWASSYSPLDQSRIVNASAYRAFVLAEGFKHFGNDKWKIDAVKYINFVVQAQQVDGSWPYAQADEYDGFIDHFHTCFVLKNLFKANLVLKDNRVDVALRKGYDFYRTKLFDQDNCPVPFYPQGRNPLVKYEMYDWAEAINLGVLYKDYIPGAFDLSVSLADKVCRDYQTKQGHYYTKIYRGNWAQKMAYIRWPQAQMFYALTEVLKVSGFPLALRGFSRWSKARE
jgi:hypothetical protein